MILGESHQPKPIHYCKSARTGRPAGTRRQSCDIIPEPLGKFIIRLWHTPVALIQAESRVTGIPLEDCNGHKSIKGSNISLNKMFKKAPSLPSICLFVLKMKTHILIIGKGLFIKYSLLRFTLP